MSEEEKKKGKKRKGDAPEEEENKIACTLWEFPDPMALTHVWSLHLPQKEELRVSALYDRKWGKKQKSLSSDRYAVRYPDTSAEKGGAVRLCAEGPSLQHLKGWQKRAVTWRNYHDLDFSMCGPTILLHILQQEACLKDKYCDPLRRIVDRALSQPEHWWQEIHPEKKKAKELLNGALYGRKTSDLPEELQHLKKMLMKAYKKLARNFPSEWSAWMTIKEQQEEKERQNLECKFASHLVTLRERKCLDALHGFLEKESWTVGVLANDGLMVERQRPLQGDFQFEGTPQEDPFPTEVLHRAQNHIFHETKIRLQIKEKDLRLSLDEYQSLYYGPLSLGKVPLCLQPYHLLSRLGHQKDLRRLGDSVMCQEPDFPQVYRRLMDSKSFIGVVMKGYPTLHYKMEDLQTWFRTVDTADFPIITPSYRFVGFKDCCYDLEELKALSWEDFPAQDSCTLFFPKTLQEVRETKTPLWDKLLLHHCTAGEKRVLEILIGRLQYPLKKYDGWQVYPNIYGEGGRGKSAVAEVVMGCFGEGEVATIGGAHEKTFGLQGFEKKRLICVQDTPENFHTQVSQSDFQRMVSGEECSAPVKGGQAWSGKWKVPFIMFGNFLPRYRDTNTSISRRTFAKRFTKPIEEKDKDTMLAQKILQQELPSILIRCVEAYRDACRAWGDKGFWFMAGPEFKHMQNDTLQQTSPLDVFLSEGDYHNVQVGKREGAYLPYRDFQKAYKMFMEEHHKGEPQNIDLGKLLARGFEVKELNMCALCKKRAVKAECKCESPVRRKILMIRNMTLDQWDYEQQCFVPKGVEDRFMPEGAKTTKELDDLFKTAEAEEKKDLDEEIAAHEAALKLLKFPDRGKPKEEDDDNDEAEAEAPEEAGPCSVTPELITHEAEVAEAE